MPHLVLFESAIGYTLFEADGVEEIGSQTEEFQKAINDQARFGEMVKMIAFHPFSSTVNALDNCNAISEGIMTEDLKSFLEVNLPKVKKSKKIKLFVADPKIGNAISENLEFPCVCNDKVREVVRAIRTHLVHLVSGLEKKGVLKQAQLGLGHSYSRSKVKYNVNRADTMIIQAICVLDQMDKDLNTLGMRCREWYSWTFPELSNIIKEHNVYARSAKIIGDKNELTEEKIAALKELLLEDEMVEKVLAAARSSMGVSVGEFDQLTIGKFVDQVIQIAEERQKIYEYLCGRMEAIAPNLTVLIGPIVAARLISHAGSLTNLAKCPASTLQILGAEKALFRALKTRGNTPKYGLIFHSSFIGRADTKNKGRISRYLANKAASCARIDCFSDNLTEVYGEKMKEQVEERLNFYATGEVPRKNSEVMAEAAEAALKDIAHQKDLPKEELEMPITLTKSKKRAAPAEETEEAPKKKSKKVKKEKKSKKKAKKSKK
eukprot:TRINITY_DN2346_c0_g4_i1.p1 TRINITY_DN2346_c0_g4~~TRINITY_DN2346_c0_g4_i1.p1  ORF type:complete len:491 (+),score=183.64 TRINITY_DN2346_c0_g4_i1:39-1511(+)